MDLKTKKVALFVTCLVDMFRPEIGFAALKLLEETGCVIEVPHAQTCCGQPAYNSGDREDAASIAKQVIKTFEAYDYVIAPSGSCAGMLKKHYLELFADDPIWADRAKIFGEKVHELISFLTDTCGISSVGASFDGTVTYHDSCSGLRELGIADQPRALLKTVNGLQLKEMQDSNVCCGFGGLFCVKYSDVSNKIVSNKIKAIVASGADTLLAGDLGCLMNMAGKLQREGYDIKAKHVAEILAGMNDAAAIGEPRE